MEKSLGATKLDSELLEVPGLSYKHLGHNAEMIAHLEDLITEHLDWQVYLVRRIVPARTQNSRSHGAIL